MTTTHNVIQTETVIVTEAAGVAARRCLTLAGDYPADDTVAIYGITHAAADNGKPAQIDVLGRIEVEVSAAVAVDDVVASGADGRVAELSGNNKFAVGRVVKAAAAAGGICEIVRGI